MRGKSLASEIAIELGLYLADEAEGFISMVDSAILPEAWFDLPSWPERAAAIRNSVDLFRDRAARAIARRSGYGGDGTMTTDKSVENPTWATNLALRTALGILAKTGFGDDCCDNDGCCMFYGSIADDNASRADGLATPLTFSEASELERKAGMFEEIAKAIREVLVKFPPK